MPDELLAAVARQQIQERIARASAPKVRTHHHRGRHRLADRLRRAADRLDS